MIDFSDPATFAGSCAALVGAWFGVKKYRRSDRQEESGTDVVVSLNGAMKLVYDQLQQQLTALALRLKEVEKQLQEYIEAHRLCENEKNVLKLENDALKRERK